MNRPSDPPAASDVTPDAVAADAAPRKAVAADLIEFQPDIVEIEERPIPGPARLTLYAILACMIAAALYASLAHIETVVTAEGRTTTRAANIVLQPLETSIVRSIAVEPGQTVEKDELLATLDATFVDADVTATRANRVSLAAEVARLEAEFSGVEPGALSSDPTTDAVQRFIFQRRQAQRRSRLAKIDAEVVELLAEISANEVNIESYRTQTENLDELVALRLSLLDRGLGGRPDYISAVNDRLRAEGEMKRLIGEQSTLGHRLASKRAEKEEFLGEWSADVGEQLVQRRRELDEINEEFKKSAQRRALVELRAPADGVVLEIAERSAGSVIQQAEELFTLVPLNEPIEVELEILTQDIGRVQPGQPVTIKLTSLPFMKHGFMEGRIRLISEDAFEDESRDAAARTFYKARATITAQDLRSVPESFRLIPGMTVSGDVKVGERRLITYFLYPILRTIEDSFDES